MNSPSDLRTALRFYLSSGGKRGPWVACLLVLAGLSEGIGITAILPLLAIATGELASMSANSAKLISLFEQFGIPLRLEPLLLLLVAAILFKTLLRFVALVEADAMAASIGRDLRIRLLDALADANWSYFVRQSSGQLANTASIEVDRVGRGATSSVNFIAATSLVLFYLGVSLWVSWPITAIAIGVGLLTAAVMWGLVKSARRAARSQTSQLRRMIGEFADVLTNFKPLKAMGAHSAAFPGLQNRAREIAKHRRHEVMASVGLQSLYEPILVILLAAGLLVAIRWSKLSLAELLFSAALFQRIMTSIGALQQNFQTVTRYQPNFENVMQTVFGAERQMQHWPGKRVVDFTHEIALERVTFSYESEDILNGLSFTVRAGELTTLLGPSGSGKTTCIDLICGLYTPSSGRITVDGVPLSEVSLDCWRSQIGYVPQEPVLFNASILHNVALSLNNVDRTLVERALALAGAMEFVAAMPQGVDSMAGERGLALSGGQRQRIAIARSLYRQPRILILDEATSALDPASEAAICATLESLKRKVTMLAISHRPAIAEISDKVISFQSVKSADRSDVQREGVLADRCP